MTPFGQAVKVARQLLSEGRTGSDLANNLHPVVSVLSPQEKRKLAARISREYLILGHAAHDPNMYRTCQAAKEAKENSPDPNLKILTYRTPMCGSCGFNRSARCGLMGGTLIDGPDNVPEKAVHKTADILIANRTLGENEARTVEMGDGNPTSRVAGLHDRKIKATTFVEEDTGVKARIASRRAASILEPAESFEIKPKRLTGPARKVNAEALGIGVVDEDEDTGVDFNSMFGSDMHVDLPANLKDDRSIAGMVDQNSEIDTPNFDRTSSEEEEDQDVQAEIQASFLRLAGLASRMLSEGAMSAKTASDIYQKMQIFQENGARHTRKTARIERQIDALGGGMQL